VQKLLGATRLSSDTDASTSIERQREQITLTAQARGDTIIAITEDVDISGTVSPFLRPSLGPWLSEPARIAQWNCLAFTRIDRVSRNLLDFVTLLKWADEHGKSLISISEGVDFGTPVGRLIGQILAMFAEFEVARMSERRADAAKKLYSRGGWNGGQSLTWGYRPVTRNGVIELVPDPELAELINEIADNVLTGTSVQAEARRVGIDQQTLLRRLRRPALKGLVVFKGQIVRAADGLPIRREPIIETTKWDRLQAKLDANARGQVVPADAFAWLHVLKCDDCKQDLYAERWSNRPYFYLGHKKLKRHIREGIEPCVGRHYNGHDVEALIEPTVMRAFGDMFIPERVELPAEDHTDELSEVEEAIDDLRGDRYQRHLFRGDAGTAQYTELMTSLEARAEELRAMPTLPARQETILSADRFRDRWDDLDDAGRGALLRRMGVGLYAKKDARGLRLVLRQSGTRFGPGPRRSTDSGPDLAEWAGPDDEWPGLVMDESGRIHRPGESPRLRQGGKDVHPTIRRATVLDTSCTALRANLRTLEPLLGVRGYPGLFHGLESILARFMAMFSERHCHHSPYGAPVWLPVAIWRPCTRFRYRDKGPPICDRTGRYSAIEHRRPLCWLHSRPGHRDTCCINRHIPAHERPRSPGYQVAGIPASVRELRSGAWTPTRLRRRATSAKQDYCRLLLQTINGLPLLRLPRLWPQTLQLFYL
jgi:site-specific DNA recombinase